MCSAGTCKIAYMSDVHVQLFVSDSANLEPTALLSNTSRWSVSFRNQPGTNNRTVQRPSVTRDQADEIRYRPCNSGTIGAYVIGASLSELNVKISYVCVLRSGTCSK